MQSPLGLPLSSPPSRVIGAAAAAILHIAVPPWMAALIAPAALWYDWLFRTAVWPMFVGRFGASGNNSVVECDLAKVEVAGSNPVSRSTCS